MRHAPQRIEPGPGQESVWDYPRPPRIEPCQRRVRILFGGEVVADSVEAQRVLETASPPTIYIPIGDIWMDLLVVTNDIVGPFKGEQGTSGW